MLSTLPVLLALAQAAPSPPLPEGNAYVRALVSRQRSREEALNRYTYDVEEIEEDLDGKGLVRKTETRRYEVFHVKGRPIRKQVALNGRPLEGAAAQKEERRVKEKVDDVLDDRTARELPEVRLSQVLARYDFQAVGREEVDGRPTLVFSVRARCRESALSRRTSSCGGWPAASGWTRKSASSCARRCAIPTRSRSRSASAPRCRVSR